jgi:hypothetical protein
MAEQASQGATQPSASVNPYVGGSTSMPSQQGPAAQQQATNGPQSAAQYQPGGSPGGASGYSLWTFTPSFSAAVFATSFYLLVSIASFIQLLHYRDWYLQLTPKAAIGAAFAGAVHVHAVLHPSVQTAYIIQQTIFQIMPSQLGAMAVVTFSRVILWVAPDEKRNRAMLGLPPSMISAVWAGALFVPDVFKVVGGALGRPRTGVQPDPTTLLNRV